MLKGKILEKIWRHEGRTGCLLITASAQKPRLSCLLVYVRNFPCSCDVADVTAPTFLSLPQVESLFHVLQVHAGVHFTVAVCKDCPVSATAPAPSSMRELGSLLEVVWHAYSLECLSWYANMVS